MGIEATVFAQFHFALLCFVSGQGTALLTNERMVRGRKGSGYLERKYQGMNGPGNVPRRERSAVFIRSRERMVQGTNIPGNEYC